MTHRLLFLRKFLAHRTRIGAVWPSSRWVARAMTAGLLPGDRVVELGAGTGAVTAEIWLHAPGRVLAIERDPDFCELLGRRFPSLEVVRGDAVELARILAARGLPRADHILCGLPLPWVPAPERWRLLDAARRALVPGGTFRQLTYMPWLHARWYRQYFGRVRCRLVIANLPPCGVYVCETPRHPGRQASEV